MTYLSLLHGLIFATHLDVSSHELSVLDREPVFLHTLETYLSVLLLSFFALELTSLMFLAHLFSCHPLRLVHVVT